MHRTREESLDESLYNELKYLKNQAQENNNLETKLKNLIEKSELIEQDIESILMERIRDKTNEERYNRMVQKKENELFIIKEQIEKYKNINITVKKKKEQIKTSIDLLDDIIANGSINEAHLRMLIDKIIIYKKMINWI